MKLNAEILYEELKMSCRVEMIGYHDQELSLMRPEFLYGEQKELLAGHLYILTGDRLSRRTLCQKGAVLVAAGELPQLSFLTDRCCFLMVKSETDVFSLFNQVQQIYNKYDAWSEALSGILQGSLSIDEMASLSSSIFRNPVLVLDSRFRFLARGGYEGLENVVEAFEDPDSVELSINALDQFLEEHEPLLNVRDPLLLNIRDTSTLSLNLFDQDEYTGSISIEYRNHPHRKCDIPLLSYFSGFVLSAIRKNSAGIMNDRSVLRRVFLDLINGLPVDTAHRKYLETAPINKKYQCLVIQINSRFAQIPVDYIIRKVDNIFSSSITFENRSAIISFVESKEGEGFEKWQQELEEKISLLVGTMDLKVGLSSHFSDPFAARSYYLQALSALENGLRIHPDDIVYRFSTYVLNELIHNAQSDLPLDIYYSDGFRKLMEHDADSSVSYVDTLRTYLNNNMAVTKTARDLFIHRSTLLERLERIKEITGEDYLDPDVRLRQQIILKALEFRKQEQ